MPENPQPATNSNPPINCRHCGAPFFLMLGKPGFKDECPDCLAASGQYSGPTYPNTPRDTVRRQQVSSKLSGLPPWIRSVKTRWRTRCIGCTEFIQIGSNMLISMGTTAHWHEDCFLKQQAHEASLQAGARAHRPLSQGVS